MTHDTPLPPGSPCHLREVRPRVLSTAQLRARGVPAAELTGRCRPGGPWRLLLPGVVLLRPGPPTGEERLHGALLYAARESAPGTPDVPGVSDIPGVPVQPTARGPHRPEYAEAMITGLAALTLHGFGGTPELSALNRVDVLVPRLRRLRSTGYVRLVRTPELPAARAVAGLPVAPVARALADAVAEPADAAAVRRLLTEAVRGGHCDAAAVVRELTTAKLLERAHVAGAVDALLAEGRALAEERLYRMVREYGLPDPLWNVDLRLPGGPHLGGLDAYWPEQAVAVELDTRARRQHEDAQRSGHARKREHLERLGITVVHITPRALAEAAAQQAAVVRTALMAAADRDPAAYVLVLPR